ncbi:hypothetical protein [Nonomuraea typhae]|uniref:XRE family transcriptional regulator n=1 Tax=Nonomuraea typhae TaxID=2603600 RepID=A0ABW7Z8B3_9ACTN
MSLGNHAPGPEDATTPAEFALAMLRLKAWSGLSYRQLEKRAASAGESLPRTSIASALDQGRLPAEYLVGAFVRACGDGDAVARWLAVRRAVAAAHAGGGYGPHGRQEPGHGPHGRQERAGGAYGPDEEARPGYRFWADRVVRRSAAAAGVATLLALGAVWLFLGPFGRGSPAPSSSATREPTATEPSPGGVSRVASPNPVTGLKPPTDRQLRVPPAAAPGAAVVLYVGDAIGGETAAAVTYFVQASGKGAVRAVTAKDAEPCDFLKRLPGLLEDARPRVVVLQFWRSSAGCADKVAAVIAGRAVPARTVWVLQGPDKEHPERTRRLNEEVYQPLADRTGGQTADAGRQVSLAVYPYERIAGGRYKWTAWIPCNEEERLHGLCTNPRGFGGIALLHPEDDPVSLCLEATVPARCLTRSPGVIRYSRVIAEAAVAAAVRP